MRRAYAGVLLAMTVLLIGTTGTPLYDGIGFPDEPYRYVHPPQGYQQKYQPTEARATVAMANGTNRREGQASSSENGPQVSLYIPPGELHVTSGAAAVVIRARAVAAAMLPTDGSANSNVYDVDLGPDPVTLSGDPPNVANITMREAVFQPVLAVMEYRPDAKSAWRRLETQQVGRDIRQQRAPLATRDSEPLHFAGGHHRHAACETRDGHVDTLSSDR